MDSFIETTVQGIDSRIAVLQSAKAALLAVEGDNGSPAEAAPQRPAAPAPTGGRTSSRRGRPAGGGQNRSAQAFDLVKANPGITIPDLANRMGIQPNYLYRVLPKLAQEGQIKREGQGWVVV